jgi:hypothetical protein
MTWKPSTLDVQWTEGLIRAVRQGGRWFTTDGRVGYILDHANKTLITLVQDNTVLHNRIQVLFNGLGWVVTDAEMEVEEDNFNPKDN